MIEAIKLAKMNRWNDIVLEIDNVQLFQSL